MKSNNPTVDFTVAAGSVDIQGTGGSKYRVRKVTVHPKFDKGGDTFLIIRN
jgi:hypothetical protein